MSDSVVIIAAKRTPIGSMNGQLLSLSSPQLASVAIKAAFEQSGLKAEDITEALIGCVDGEPAGFAVFFHNYSTFLAQPGIYLEDLFVDIEHRGRGLGKALLRRLAQLAVERGCGRLEWSVLDWNEPAIGFYKKLGAKPMDEWTIFRVTGAALKSMGELS